MIFKNCFPVVPTRQKSAFTNGPLAVVSVIVILSCGFYFIEKLLLLSLLSLLLSWLLLLLLQILLQLLFLLLLSSLLLIIFVKRIIIIIINFPYRFIDLQFGSFFSFKLLFRRWLRVVFLYYISPLILLLHFYTSIITYLL